MNIVGSDDSGAVCIWGQNKNVIRLYTLYRDGIMACSYLVNQFFIFI